MKQNKLYVGNLSFSTTQSDLENAFAEYGEIEEAKIITDRHTDKSRGFAFVTFVTQHSAESALAMNGEEMDGRKLIVNIAKEREGGRAGGGPRRGRF